MAWRWPHEDGLPIGALLLLSETPLAAMTAVAELSLLCQIDKMTWERGGGRFCFFFNFSKKSNFPHFA
jgi:hypothetical protein